MILGVAEGLALVTAAAALVGRLQADTVNLKSLEDKVEHLLHPAPGFRFAGTHGVGISATKLRIRPDDFVKSPTVNAEPRIDTNSLTVRGVDEFFDERTTLAGDGAGDVHRPGTRNIESPY